MEETHDSSHDAAAAGKEEETAPLDVAQAQLLQLFSQDGYWKPHDLTQENAASYTHQKDAVDLATTSAIEIVDLLREYPALASQLVKHCDGSFLKTTSYGLNSYYPLTLLVLNNFDTEQLDMIYRLFPKALFYQNDQPTQPTMLHVACKYPFVSDEVLLWLSSLDEGGQILASRDTIFSSPLDLLLKAKRDAKSFVSLKVLQAFLEEANKFATDYIIKDKPLLGALFALGYGEDCLQYVADQLPEVYDTLHLDDNRYLGTAPWWEFDVGQAKVIERILPRLTKLVCRPPKYEVGGWVYLLNAISKSTHLQEFVFELPMRWLGTHQQGRNALQQFFERKPASSPLQHIKMDAKQLEEPTTGTNKTALDKANDMCFQSIDTCLKANKYQNACFVETLELDHFSLFSYPTLAQLGQLVSNLKLSQVQLGENDDNDDDEDKKLRIASASFSQCRLERLEMKKIEIATTSCAKMLFGGISQMPKLRELRIHPMGPTDLEFVFIGLKELASCQNLVLLDLGPVHAGDFFVDITESLVDLLKTGRLSTLRINCAFLGEDHHTHVSDACYIIEAAPICAALKENATLKTLVLHHVDFDTLCDDEYDFEAEAKKIPKLFMEVVKDRNTTLESMSITDGRLNYTIGERAPGFDSVSVEYADYNCALEIQYLQWLNHFGRQKLRDKATTCGDLLALLVEALKPRSSVVGQTCAMLDAFGRNHDDKDNDPLDCFNVVFTELDDNIDCWVEAWQHQIDTASIVYGLLRESPSLWCAGEMWDCSNRKRKRF